MEDIDLNLLDKYGYLPTFLEIKYSCIKNGGLGVFAKAKLPAGKFLGNYTGVITEKLPENLAEQFYTFESKRDGMQIYINATDLNTSNWTRFMNCSMNDTSQNITCVNCRNNGDYYLDNVKYNIEGYLMFYVARDIAIGEELLYDYGEKYVNYLINFTASSNVSDALTKP